MTVAIIRSRELSHGPLTNNVQKNLSETIRYVGACVTCTYEQGYRGQPRKQTLSVHGGHANKSCAKSNKGKKSLICMILS